MPPCRRTPRQAIRGLGTPPVLWIDLAMSQVIRLIIVAVIAVFVAAHIGPILTVLIAALITLGVVRWFWPRPRG